MPELRSPTILGRSRAPPKIAELHPAALPDRVREHSGLECRIVEELQTAGSFLRVCRGRELLVRVGQAVARQRNGSNDRDGPSRTKQLSATYSPEDDRRTVCRLVDALS